MSRPDQHYRDLLEAKKEELLELAETSSDERKPVELDQSKVGRLSRMDALQVQAMSSALDARRKNEITRIESALTRLEEGEFGFCLVCGEDIEEDRLKLDPAAPKCTACAKAAEKKSPTEEH